MNARAPTRGFTLVEVLVALVIVAFGMGAVLAALSSAADSIIRLREKTFAEWVGFNQLSATRLKAGLPSTGDTGGVVEFAAARWRWQQTVTAMDIPGLRRIVIRVRRADATTTAQSQAANDKSGDWLATIMGFRGDALQTPLDVLANWDGGLQGPGGANPGDNPGPGGTTGPGGTPAPGSIPTPGGTPTHGGIPGPGKVLPPPPAPGR